MSHSENRARQTQTSSTDVNNLNVQDTEGLTLVNSSGNNLSFTDAGTVAASTEISRDALDLGRRSVEGAFDFGSDTLSQAFSFGSDAVLAGTDLAGRGMDSAIDAVSRANSDSLDFAGRTLADNQAFSLDGLDTIASFAETSGAGVLDFAKGLFGDSLKGINDLALQTSSTSDDRVLNIAKVAFLAVAAVMVLPAVFGKK